MSYTPPISGATSVTRGTIKLTGDIAGTADAPQVVGLAGKYTKPSAGIPSADLDASIRSALAKAETALQSSKMDHINLLDYLPGGPNGTTDNSAIIRQAIIDAAAGPRRLFIPSFPSPWVIGSPVLIDVDIVVYGSGWKLGGPPTIQLKAGLNNFGFVFDTTKPDGNHVVFRDLDIDGNGSQQTNGGIIAANNAVQCLFDHVHLYHAYNVALWLHGQQGAGPYGHHNRIINCLFDNSGTSAGDGIGLIIQSCDETMVSDSDFEANGNVNGTSPYHIKDWSGINAYVNCVFVGGGEGIRMQDMSGSRVIGCMFDGLGRDAIHISGSNVQISACHFWGMNTPVLNIYSHIALENGGYCSITGNVFDSGSTNTAVRGFVRHYATSSHHAVTGNVFRINTGSLGSGGVYDWSGSSATASGSVVKSNVGLADQ